MNHRITLITILLIITIEEIKSTEDGYLRYLKDGCFIKNEALSCVKYKALKIAKKTIFGDDMYANETIKANRVISFVPLDEETVRALSTNDDKEVEVEEPRSILSEWSSLAKYFMRLVKDFFKMKGLRVNLPDGARTIEEQDQDDGRGRKKKLAILIPLLTLMATLKTKLMLIPVLLSVLLIKKLLLIAALLLPSLLSTLKHCKHHPHHYSVFGSSDTSDFSSDYGNSYSYSSGGGYGKDWASNRAYSMPKHRPTPAPVFMTAPGNVA